MRGQRGALLAFGAWLTGGDGGDEGGFEDGKQNRGLGWFWVSEFGENGGLGDVVRVRGR